MRDAVIVSAVRTAVGKAPKGMLRATRPDDLGATAIQGALERVPELDKARGRRRHHRLRDAGGGAGNERGPDLRAARGHAGRIVRHDDQSLLRLRACSRSRWRRSGSAAAAPT